LLTKDQENARQLIYNWIENLNEPFFVLAGYAGTGKTYLMKLFVEEGIDIIFSATTNKAANVLSKTVGKNARTIHSLLALKVKEKEDSLILIKDIEGSNLENNSIVVIDEASMIGPELFTHINNESRKGNRFIFVGDPAQLPPVKEKESPIWDILKIKDCSAKLLEVVRNDNQLLNVATKIRKCIQTSYFNNPILDDYGSDGKGVRVFSSYKEFKNNLINQIPSINFEETKIIAWRNKTVDYYNHLVREQLGYKLPWVVGEKILCGSPVIRDGKLIASTDDELTIKKVEQTSVFLDKNQEIDVWELKVKEINFPLYIPRDRDEVDTILNRQATIAQTSKKYRKEEWKKYWNIRNIFDDIRYTYAITAHKSQGTTLKECYIDSQDILSSIDLRESFRCLYVAVTRPTDCFYTY
jgi:exodeoxyribonuclease-5